MRVTSIHNDTLSHLTLPEKVDGQYWVTITNPAGKTTAVVSIEGINGHWTIKSNRTAWLLDGNRKRIRQIRLETDAFYEVALAGDNTHVLIHVEPTTTDRLVFTKLSTPVSVRVRIGRGDNCEISFASAFMSSEHAEFVFGHDSATISDLGSVNGTFVNRQRIKRPTHLAPGDVISLLGLMIVVGRGFIAINNPDGLVTFRPGVFTPIAVPSLTAGRDDEEIEESSPESVFVRSPRFKRSVATAKISIDGPPAHDDREEMPLMMVLGPALTMGIASLFMGVFALINVLSNNGRVTQALPTLIMSLSMMTGMILWPILARRHERRRKQEREAKRQTKYRRYLTDTHTAIESERTKQADIARENVHPLENCLQRIGSRTRTLWERTTDHDDFLSVRLGTGDGVFDLDLRHPERHFTLDDDDLQDEMLKLADTGRSLPKVPVSVSLLENPVLGIIGQRPLVRKLLTGMLLQLLALHGPDELKLIVVYDRNESEYWDFLRYIPHLWSDDRSVRFLANSSDDLRRLTAVLEPEITRRKSISETEPAAHIPHYVIVALDSDISARSELLTSVLRLTESRGFYAITAFDHLSKLPRECRAIVEVSDKVLRLYDRSDTSGSYRSLHPDALFGDDPRAPGITLANTQRDTMSEDYKLPAIFTFLEMFGVGKVEHLNVGSRWRESNPVISLEAPVGVGEDGELVMLDLHEKRDGPHGLIAGMTGSGKSEFIMTYILSLAVSYSPDDLNLVLIDYKGGGMANAFAGLPHVVGTITNLDGAAINRSLVSLQSELRRRQAILNAAADQTGISAIDIYKYQSLVREGKFSEPLPHLVVISDEFAELKSQQPEFMSQLVSAARIGRSLGVHLILATQKPSGVVDDQIWSNSRFRICLKVQERADSMEVIKRPDAAALTETGRFYLQVGFDEVFAVGQSAWAGAPYYPVERLERAYDNSVVLVDTTGRALRQAAIDRRRSSNEAPSKQLDTVTAYLRTAAEAADYRPHPLWMPAIPESIYADEIESPPHDDFELAPLVGLYDDPANQQQLPLTVDFSALGNAIVYGATGSGKTLFVSTLIASLLEEHTPEQVQLYLLDFEAEALRSFGPAPHVGDVLGSQDSEKIDQLFSVLEDEVTRRRTLYASVDGDLSALRDAGESLPRLVVVIHNYSGFIEGYDEHEDALATLSREGSRYGLYFVLTSAGTTAIRFRVAQNFRQLFVLQLNDPAEYGAVLGSVGALRPAAHYGRGIIKTDAAYEFQTAWPIKAAAEDPRYIREWATRLGDDWQGASARPVPVLPQHLPPQLLVQTAGAASLAALPIGIAVDTIQPYSIDLQSNFVTLVAHDDDAPDGFLKGLDTLLTDFCHVPATFVAADAAEETAQALFAEMVKRNHAAVDARETGAAAPQFAPNVYIIASLSTFLAALSADGFEKFTTTLQKCDANLMTTFVLCDQADTLRMHTSSAWLLPHVRRGNGVWVGNGFGDKHFFELSSFSTSFYDPLKRDRGYAVGDGQSTLIQLVDND